MMDGIDFRLPRVVVLGGLAGMLGGAILGRRDKGWLGYLSPRVIVFPRLPPWPLRPEAAPVGMTKSKWVEGVLRLQRWRLPRMMHRLPFFG